MIHCQGCHLPDGSGNPPDVPSFTGQLGDFLLVDGGRAYLVQVPGTANAPLDDRSVAELLNWMLERFSGRMRPTNFVPYSAEEVADYRREKLADPAARRKALLAALPGA
jgi:mono/diheme cytochrome c family protein